MTEENDNEEPRIIVDENWKSQVEKEKEQLRQSEERGETSGEPELPPASFLGLLSMLGSQAMAALGVLPDFATGETSTNRPLAKHCIDMIGVLQEKTRNNLSEDEAAHVRDALHQLRMIYVSTASTGDASPESRKDDEGSSPSIELP